ncbi:EamA family transporter RarD [Futiania mangrovi]|uniref:EamA family transporter RarD n=1 Tax=Futiania mangrovi TaxID=2959716 RepID=A0A9J6PD60_9PROT|nr:EamA family transporter RarD [Futiania mangrovii]MCP1335611.1 EamA family transporter RarD [Futiania mangrovii]
MSAQPESGPAPVRPTREDPGGLAAAFGAYALWGVLPVLWKEYDFLPAIDTVAHRVIWCLLLLLAILPFRGTFGNFLAGLRDPRRMAVLTVTAAVIGLNWTVFIWAVGEGHILEASLGYFLNPLFSVLLGFLLLGEKLTRLQWLAILMAAAAVANQIVAVGAFPWVALGVAGSFGLYGYLRKITPVGPAVGLATESLIGLPVAVGWLLLFGAREAGSDVLAGFDSGWHVFLLLMTGPATAAPLLLFATAARRIRLATVGILQYVAPSIMFALAVFLYGEPLDAGKLATFALIWAALALYTWEMLRPRGPVPIPPTGPAGG